MSSAVTNGNVEKEDDDTVPAKSKKARKSMPSGMMVIRKKDWNRNISEKPVVKGKLSMDKEVEEQIFNGPISPYVPKLRSNIESSNQDETETFFTCIDCGDKFLFESSLNMHLSRRSVKISMWCPGLSEPKIFYNRCKLLANLREHMDPSAGLSARISLYPLEKERLLLGTKESPSSDHETENSSTPKKTCKILPKPPATPIQNEELVDRLPVYLTPLTNSRVITNSNIPSTSKVHTITSQTTLKKKTVENSLKFHEDKSPSVAIETHELEVSPSPLKTETNEIMDIDKETKTDKCPECNWTGTDLKYHFAGGNINSSKFKCNKCNILLPTFCSLKCHEHLHSSDIKENTNNFICPECGIKFEKWEPYFKHLHNDCMHAYYSECFKCQNCSNMFPTSISLEVHILKTHMKKIFKCSTCNVAFYSNETLKKHYDDTHHNENGKRTMIYHICQLCPGRMVTQSLLLFHVHQHAEDTICSMLRYVCEPCRVYVEHKEDFINHKKSCDKVVSKYTKTQKNTDEKDVIDTHMKSLPAQIPKKSVIKESSIKIKNYKSNVTINNNNNNKRKFNSIKKSSRPCHKCGTTMQPYKYKMLACFKCNKSLINKTLKKSNSSKNNISTKNLNGDCSDDSNSAIVKIKNEEHCKAELQSDNIEHFECSVCKVSLSDNFDTIKEHFSDNHEKLYNSFEWCPNTYKQNILSCVDESDVDDVIISSKFTCNICHLQTDEEEEFREHVISHRPGDSPAYQCLECGMCYVVKPSLEKHLLLTHKIRGVDEYLKESGQNHDEELGIEGPPLKENQCKVCYKEFESPQELNSHLRTHGLAFLLNKRGSDLLRSP